MSVVALRDVAKSYAGSVAPTLRGIDLDLDAASTTAILGRSGAGKSTLLNILGLLDRPTSGTVTIGGQDMASASEASRTRTRAIEIGFVFQQYFLLQQLSSVENVELGLAYTGIDRKSRRGLAQTALELVEMADFEHQSVATLSGGQQQRVAIARAIAKSPSILYCDEPTGNLDQETGDGVLELLLRISRGGAAVVIITHDEALALRTDRAVRLVAGQLARDHNRRGDDS